MQSQLSWRIRAWICARLPLAGIASQRVENGVQPIASASNPPKKVELRKPRRKMTKKEPTRNCVRASSVAFVFYANLVAIVMTVVAVNPMPVPVVRGTRGITIVSIRSVVSIRVIAITIRVIAIVIAVPIGRITKSDSHAPNSH